jgi:sugar phosphate isomerase/epimerase
MTTLKTRTGDFTIGFRRGGKWQSDLSQAIEWAIQQGFGAIDLSRNPDEIATVTQAGLRVGSVDLAGWQGLMSPDASERADAAAKTSDYIAACGAQNYFAVMVPKDPSLPRLENFGAMVNALHALSGPLEAAGGRLVIEGWPGAGSLCCTPETFRAAFRECPSPSIGINYDPSHLLRMGIDPIRFLKEFVSRVGHVHGKDTLILADDLYEYGHELPAVYKKDPFCGASAWRYTIPGHGGTPWTEVCQILSESGYAGAICIELEDSDYHGSPEAEQRGLRDAGQFLSTC